MKPPPPLLPCGTACHFTGGGETKGPPDCKENCTLSRHSSMSPKAPFLQEKEEGSAVDF